MDVLVDADILLYRCGFSADSQCVKTIQERESCSREAAIELAKEEDYLAWALHNVKNVLRATEEAAGTLTKIILSGPYNFREQVATLLPYKGNRDASHKPKYYKEIKEYLISSWNASTTDSVEADDELGMEQTVRGDSSIIATLDKDLDMIAGWHYNFKDNRKYYLSQEEADTNFFRQMITGDTTDNIPGIKGLGPINAQRVIDSSSGLDDLRRAVQSLYRAQYGVDWERAYTEVGALLWILRYPEEVETGSPILW